MIERAGDAPSKSNRRTTRTPKRFFKPLTQTMPRIFHGLLCDKSDEFVKFEKMCGDPRRILLTCRLLSAKLMGTHRVASIPKESIMHARLRQTRTKSRRSKCSILEPTDALYLRSKIVSCLCSPLRIHAKAHIANGEFLRYVHNPQLSTYRTV